MHTNFSYLNVIYVGLSIFLAIMLIYFFWVYFIFRYSQDRIGAKLSNIYTNPSVNHKIQYVTHSNQGVTLDKSHAFATMTVRDIITGIPISSEIFTVENKPNCTPLDTNCVNL